MIASPLSGHVKIRKVRAGRIGLAGDGTARVALSGGEVSIIDSTDVQIAAAYSWRRTREGYVIATGASGSTVLLHRLITAAPRGMDVDHINHDPLDNRRCNLRVCLRAQNSANRRPSRGFSSRFKGVSVAAKMARVGRPWKATIQVEGAKRHLGFYVTELEAAQAYDAAALSAWSEFALVNFPIRNLADPRSVDPAWTAGHETTPTRSRP